MKRITGFILGLALAFAGAGRIAGDTPSGMVPQPAPFCTGGGPFVPGTVNWQGVPGRTYQMQWSTDLQNWSYLPLTEEGAGAKSYGTMFSSNKAFTRLLCSDETPDLAKGTSWAPPLLTVTGQWKVSTIAQNSSTGGGAQAASMLPASMTPSSIPVPGVNLTFYRWNAGASAPDTTPILVASTGTDGGYTFDPYAYTPAFVTGDRVQVCISGSPNQRVYLPSDLVGSETPDPATPGGNSGGGLNGISLGTGLSVSDIVPAPASGASPVFNKPTANEMSVYRFMNFLTDYFYDGIEDDKTSPTTPPPGKIDDHYVEVDYTDPWDSSYDTTKKVYTQDYQPDPYPYAGMGNFDLLQSYGASYNNQLSADFGSSQIKIDVQRNIYCSKIPEVTWTPYAVIPQPSISYHPDTFTFGNGNQAICDMGSSNFPYTTEGYEAGLFSIDRYLVLGPVPMFVPKSVFGGAPFYYHKLNDIKLHAELPLGTGPTSRLFDPDYFGQPTEIFDVNCKVRWTAQIIGTATCDVVLVDNSTEKRSDQGPNAYHGPMPTLETLGGKTPSVHVEIVPISNSVFNPNFSVKVSAELEVATAIIPPLGHFPLPPDVYATSFIWTPAGNLGSFTTQFKYTDAGNPTISWVPWQAKNQVAEVRGFTGNTPESDGFNGGQRSKTLEPERKIGINGQPAPDSPTFVDALTGVFHHSETDYSLQVPGSDLALTVNRNLVDTIWLDSSGLHPDEDPLLAFGPGWNTNLASSVLVESYVPPADDTTTTTVNTPVLNNTITVRDYQGVSYAFLDYTDGNGNHSFIPDPTLLPDRSTIGISLSRDSNTGNLILRQPELGITHVYQASSLNFNIPNNRDTSNVVVTVGTANVTTNPTGYSNRKYYRLASVTDRFGVTLNYNYGGNAVNLIPQCISVVGRSALQLRLQQHNGKIQAFWDPSGVKHVYTYDDRNLASSGQTTATFHILSQHNIGPLTAASYGYNYSIEGDPRPSAMLLQTSSTTPYTITTRHIAPKAITNGVGNTVAVNYQLSTVRSSWSAAAGTFYYPAGDPMQVNSITLPDQTSVVFTLQHTLQNAHSATVATDTLPASQDIPAALSILTQVTDAWGSQWSYTYDAPTCYTWSLPFDDTSYLPSASALFFPGLTRTCDSIPSSAIQFTYDASAGFARSQTQDMEGRSNFEAHGQTYNQTPSLYTRPQISNGVSIHAFATVPSSTSDMLNTNTYHYPANSGGLLDLLPDIITDSSNRSIHFVRDSMGRTNSVQLYGVDSTLLSQNDFTYGNSALPGVLTRTARKALPGAPDPSWVTDLVKDIHPDALGFPSIVGNDAQNLHTTTVRGPSGRVLSETAPDGGKHSFVYDASGLLISTSLADGSQISYQHDPAGRTVITRDALGRATGIGYDSWGRMNKVVRSMRGNLIYNPTFGLVGDHEDIVSSAVYHDSTHKVYVTDLLGYISVYSFDPLGHISQVITCANNGVPDSVPSVSRGKVTTFEYDLFKSPDHPVLVTDPLGYKTIYQYDIYARLIRTLRQYDTNHYSGTSYGYDADTGLPISVTTTRTPLDADGNPQNSPLQQLTSSITYDALDRPFSSTFAQGTDKELITTTTYTSTGLPYQKAVRDVISPEHWSTSTLVYDSLGRPVQEILPQTSDVAINTQALPTTVIAYDNFGRLSQTSDAYGNVTTYGHDICGHLSYQKAPAVLDARSGLTLEPTTTYQYDAAGQLIQRVDPLGYAWRYDHDTAGRLVKTTGPVVSPDKDSAHRQAVWQYQYDTAGNIHQFIDAEGHYKRYDYYPDNTVASTYVPVSFTDDSGTPSIVDVVEQYQRDALGHLTRLIDGNNQSTAFTYDGLGRTLTVTRDPDDTARKRVATTYYDALLPTSTVDANGQTKNYLYDPQFRLQELDVIGHSEQNLTFIHDLLGRLTNIDPITPPGDISHGNPSIVRNYDVLGRLQTELSNGVTTTYGYDLLGQLTNISNSANIREIYIRHDAAGRTSQIDDYYGSPLFPLSTRFGYDLAGHQVVESMPNNLQKIAQLDPMGRVTCQTLLAANLKEISHTETQYDLLSNVTHIKEAYAPTLNIPSRTVDNTYNERSQLLTENQNETGGPLVNSTRTRTAVHRYDAAENRISTQSAIHDPLTTDSALTRIFEYGSATNGANSNQLHQLTETPLGGSSTITNYGYDANGNRTTKTIGSLSDLYQYDSFNRLTQLTLNTAGGDNGIYQYSYDPLTRRISRTVGDTPSASNTQQFAFSGSTPVHKWDGTLPPNSASMLDLIGGGLDSQLHIQDSNGVTTYPIQNLRGDITAQVANNGSMPWHGTYSADGLLQNQYGNRIGDYGANGKYEEPGGLLNEGFRYRDRLTGTFLTRDPAGFIDGPNDYNYVGHNPWSACDPEGLSTVLITTATVGYVPYSVAAVGGATSGVNSGIGGSFPQIFATTMGRTNVSLSTSSDGINPLLKFSSNINSFDADWWNAAYDVGLQSLAYLARDIQYGQEGQALADYNAYVSQFTPLAVSTAFSSARMLADADSYIFYRRSIELEESSSLFGGYLEPARIEGGFIPYLNSAYEAGGEVGVRRAAAPMCLLRSASDLSIAMIPPLGEVYLLASAKNQFAEGNYTAGSVLLAIGALSLLDPEGAELAEVYPRGSGTLKFFPDEPTAAKALPEVKFSASKYPELAENITHAQKAGHPSILTHGGDAAANRAAALDGVPNLSPLSRDEYPFASSLEGGAGSWVGHVPVSQQNAQGAILKNFFKQFNMQQGDQYRVIIDP